MAHIANHKRAYHLFNGKHKRGKIFTSREFKFHQRESESNNISSHSTRFTIIGQRSIYLAIVQKYFVYILLTVLYIPFY